MKKRNTSQRPDESGLCTTCGNELPPAAAVCPFCETPCGYRAPPRSAAAKFATINLKNGMPTVDEAMLHLDRALNAAILSGAQVIRIIHGWGSGGKGGAIRDETRRVLAVLQRRHRIAAVVHGEDLGERTVHGRQLLARFPILRDDRGNIGNPGITLVAP